MNRVKIREKLEARGWVRCPQNEWHLLPYKGSEGIRGISLRTTGITSHERIPLRFVTQDMIDEICKAK